MEGLLLAPGKDSLTKPESSLCPVLVWGKKQRSSLFLTCTTSTQTYDTFSEEALWDLMTTICPSTPRRGVTCFLDAVLSGNKMLMYDTSMSEGLGVPTTTPTETDG